jgi:hypothetical protein
MALAVRDGSVQPTASYWFYWRLRPTQSRNRLLNLVGASSV